MLGNGLSQYLIRRYGALPVWGAGILSGEGGAVFIDQIAVFGIQFERFPNQDVIASAAKQSRFDPSIQLMGKTSRFVLWYFDHGI